MSGPVDPLPLARYIDLIAAVPLPTPEQKEHFAQYVSHAHSWYKHLSLYPPGTPFHFHLDWFAGCEREHGTPLIKNRTEPGFHDNAIPTDVYRAAFGYLAYSRRPDNTAPLVIPAAKETRVGALEDSTPEACGANILIYGVPREIFEAGTARLTGAMHTLSAAMPWLWDEDGRPDLVDWPLESGGLAALERILDRCREMLRSSFKREETRITQWPLENYPHSGHHAGLVDPVLDELLAPERRRQRVLIIQAIDRVCEVIEDQRSRRGS